MLEWCRATCFWDMRAHQLAMSSTHVTSTYCLHVQGSCDSQYDRNSSAGLDEISDDLCQKLEVDRNSNTNTPLGQL